MCDCSTTRPETDNLDLESFLIQIMEDEFDCNVEDGSEIPTARDILALRQRMTEERSTVAAQEVEQRWRNRGQMKHEVNVQVVSQDVHVHFVQVVSQDVGDDEDWDDEDEDEEEGEAPRLVPVQPKEKVEPEVDEDGFTKVVGKKKK